jgi:hypothetical protein
MRWPVTTTLIALLDRPNEAIKIPRWILLRKKSFIPLSWILNQRHRGLAQHAARLRDGWLLRRLLRKQNVVIPASAGIQARLILSLDMIEEQVVHFVEVLIGISLVIEILFFASRRVTFLCLPKE